MQAVRVLAAGVLVLGLIGGPAPGREATVSAQASNPQGWRGVVQQGGAIEIKGVNGGDQGDALVGRRGRSRRP